MKSKITKSILDIVAVLLIFGLGQVIGGGISAVILIHNEGAHSTLFIALALLTANVIAIVLLLFLRYLLTWSQWLERVDFIAEINPLRLRWSLAPMMMIATFAGAVSTGCLAQAWGVEDRLEETIQNLATNPIGILTIVFIGPLGEELIFRHAILGGMLRRGITPWIAILVSSILFGIIHLNPIQILFASALGIMLGILYTKSQSIVPSLIYHIINNGFAVAVILIEGKGEDPTTSLLETPPILYSVSIVAAAICIPIYIYYWRKPTLNSKPSTLNPQL